MSLAQSAISMAPLLLLAYLAKRYTADSTQNDSPAMIGSSVEAERFANVDISRYNYIPPLPANGPRGLGDEMDLPAPAPVIGFEPRMYPR